MPAALYTDDFNRTDESPLSGGGNWAGGYSSQNDLAIVGNEVRMATGAGGSDALTGWTTAPGVDQWVKVKIITLSDATFAQAGVLVRLTAPTSWTSYMIVGGTTPSADIYEVTSGSLANIATSAISWAANDNIVGVIRGSTINLYKNGGVPIVTTTDATITSGRIGMTGFASVSVANAELDDFTGGTLPITLVSAGTEGDAASGNVTPGLPASIAANDILICCCHSNDQVSHSMTGDWTQIVQANGGSTTSRLSVWWHRYSGSSPSALITHSAGNGIIAGIAAFRGCKTSGSPVNVAGTVAGGTGATIAHNGVTVTIDGCLLLAINGASDDNNRTLISGWTNVLEDTGAGTNNAFVGTSDSNASRDESISMFYVDTFIGSTGTVNVTQAAADPCAGVLIALEPDLAAAEPVMPQITTVLTAVHSASFW